MLQWVSVTTKTNTSLQLRCLHLSWNCPFGVSFIEKRFIASSMEMFFFPFGNSFFNHFHIRSQKLSTDGFCGCFFAFVSDSAGLVVLAAPDVLLLMFLEMNLPGRFLRNKVLDGCNKSFKHWFEAWQYCDSLRVSCEDTESFSSIVLVDQIAVRRCECEHFLHLVFITQFHYCFTTLISAKLQYIGNVLSMRGKDIP